MKRLLLFILIFCNVCCYSQDFLGNSDYIYAVGVAKSQVEAENAALVSLAKKIGVKVSDFSYYSVTETNGKVSENYKKDIKSETSNYFTDEVETYVEAGRKNITVYKYVNVKEYVAKRQKIYNSCMSAIDSIYKRCTSIKHSKNLILGQYYLAYQALDTPLMDAYAKNNVQIKKKVFEKAQEAYRKESSFGFLTLLKKTDPRGYFVVMSGAITEGVHGIEYMHNGQWTLPYYFYYSTSSMSPDGTNDAFSSEKTSRCLLVSDNNKILARYLYEIKKDGQLYRLEVPENWYFCTITIDTNLNNVN